jgi:hypothetical protein
MHERLIVTAEVVEKHFAEAVQVRRQLDDLVAALGAAAERAAQHAPRPRFERAPVQVEDVAHPAPEPEHPYHRA